MESLNHVKLKRTLLTADLEKQITSAIDQRVKSLPNYTELKVSPELILLVCNLIENATSESKLKTDKKSLLLKVLTSIFNYTEADKKHVSEIVEFLHSNRKIKKVSLIKKIVYYAIDWVSRKFL